MKLELTMICKKLFSFNRIIVFVFKLAKKCKQEKMEHTEQRKIVNFFLTYCSQNLVIEGGHIHVNVSFTMSKGWLEKFT